MLKKLGAITYLALPGLFIAVIICIPYFISQLFDISLMQFGLHPRRFDYVYGILTMPFIHADIFHLMNNVIAMFVLSLLLYYFYKQYFYSVLLSLWLMSGLWTWALARDGIHIGASAIVYGMAAFLFFAGIFIRQQALIAISLLVVFLYGGLIWGIFPFFHHLSWEGHLSGFLSGLLIALYHKKDLQMIYAPPSDEDDEADNFDEESHDAHPY